MDTIDKKIEVDELDHVTFTYRSEINQPKEGDRSLPANIIHSLDGWIVREMYRKAHTQGFQILTIHDSFWCSPNYVNNLRKNYIDILAELAQSNYFENILKEVRGNPTLKHIKMSDDLYKEILNSEYALS